MPFEPDKITRNHIEKAVQKIKEEQIDLHSSYGYDVVIDGEPYPPKEIMRYAHEQMNGERVWEKSGGEQTNKYLENLGFEIVEKSQGSNEELYHLKRDFLNTWPLQRVKNMTLEEYTNLNKDDSFCYWLESTTEKLGSILGGNAYKFGIYKRKNTDSEDSRSGYETDGEYAWVKKYGTSVSEVFKNVKSIIVSIIEAAQSDDFSKIDEIDLGDAVKWKIAFLYSEGKVVNIYKTEAIRFVGKKKGLENADSCPISEIHNYLLELRPDDVDYFDYTKSLWNLFSKQSELSGKKYWLYSPGSSAEHWNDFYNEGIMAIGWDFLGDLTRYSKKEEIRKKLQEKSDSDSSKKNDTHACWEFVNKIHPGDIVIAKRGSTEYIGWGIVISDYEYDKEREQFKNIRKVDWMGKGSWTDKDIVQKTLTDITKYPDYVERLKKELSIRKSPTVMGDSTNSNDLNQILYGPPGTGKTYHTVNRALQIVAPKFYEDNKNNRKKLTDKFKKLLITNWEKYHGKQIATTTFHQSFTYEDFIEGIKPKIVDRDNGEEKLHKSEDEQKGEVAYEIQPGIFKRICELARQDSGGQVGHVKRSLRLSIEDFKKSEFFKYSGDFSTYNEELYNKCIKDGRLYFSYLEGLDLTSKEENEIIGLCKSNDFDTDECKYMAIFRHHVSHGNYVIFSNGNNKFRAIGKVTGDYKFHENGSYSHSRKIDWIVEGENLGVDLIYNQNFRDSSIYQLSKENIKAEFFTSQETKAEDSGDPKPYVLIIDEINRGNIAQIFGELITLIEKDKREGMDEEWPVSLPYSKQQFSVPSNLYIIGTMNTADRSIEALDTALRRRFTFEEMPPDPEIIEEHGDINVIDINGIEFQLTEILVTINSRVEKLLDKDHLIGHSYFMKVKTVEDLQRIFYKNIIPLLEEYFYGDKGKIQMVLGRGFIEKSDGSKTETIFAESDYEGASLMDEIEVWKIRSEWKVSEEKFSEALKILRNK